MTAKPTDRAIFLDRDGCISPDEFGYISDPGLYGLYPWTGEALRLLNALGYKLFIVTNQSGIARGYFGIDDLERVHAKMLELLSLEGARITKVYYSPYYQDGIVEPYNVWHEDRKPGLGMFRKALSEYPFCIKRSWMIGDRYSDIEFGRNAGLNTVLLLTGNGNQEMRDGVLDRERKPHFVAEDLLTAARLIKMLDT